MEDTDKQERGVRMPRQTANYHIRRLSQQDEFEQIRQMQVAAKEFVNHYPKHAEWLDAVISEMNKGVRLAFGVFLPRFDNRQRDIIQELVGSIIIKKGQYSKVVEMKNLYMTPDERNNSYGKALYDEVENYCRRKGYRIIETEVPCTEIDTITVLHKWGFTATKRLDSRFRQDDQIYVMEKQIRPAYAGDPFDYRAICEWYVEERWGYSLKRREDGFSIFTTKGNSPAAAEEDAPIMAVVTATRPYAVQSDLVQRASEVADMVIKFVGDGSHSTPQTDGTKAVGFQQVFASIEDDFGYFRPKFEQEDIGGVIVSFNPKVIADLRERLGKDAPYFKGGPVGRFAKNGHTALLFSEGGKRIPYGGIVGYAKIKQVKVDEPSLVQEELKEAADPLISDELYSLLFSSKSMVVGLILGDFKMIDPMERYQIEEFLGELTDVEMSEIGHRYISKTELNHFFELTNTTSKKPLDPNREGEAQGVANKSVGGRVVFGGES